MRRRSPSHATATRVGPRGLPLALAALSSLSACCLAGCGDDATTFSIVVTGGLSGGGAFDGVPAVTRVELRVRANDGTEKTIARATTTAGGLDVPDEAKTGIGALVVAGLGADGATLVYGRTPPMELSGLAQTQTAAVSIFAQRTASIAGALELASAPSEPRCTTIGSRFAVVSDGTGVHVVDLLSHVARRETDVWATAPVTLATSGAHQLAIDAAGVGTMIDFDAGTTSAATAPAGATFADVAGGAVVGGEEGAVYLVGATREGAKTDAVLRLAADGTLTVKRLLRARTGAAAAWVDGRGLVVAYGESEAETAVEILAPGAAASVALPFPTKNARGGVLALVTTEATGAGGRLVRFAADGTATFLDLACATACAETAAVFRDDVTSAREDDHAVPLEGGGAVVVRGGRVSLLPRAADKLTLLYDGKGARACSTKLPTGNVAIAFAGEKTLRTVSPER